MGEDVVVRTPEYVHRELAAQEKLFNECVRRLDQGLQAIQDEIDRRITTQAEARENIRRELQKFEESIRRELEKMNELRGALSDLGKDMATRRDLENAVVTIKAERGSLYTGLTNTLQEHLKRIGDLEQSVAVGPAELRELRSHSDESAGEMRGTVAEKRAIIAAQNKQIAMVGAVIAGLSLLVYVLTQVHP